MDSHTYAIILSPTAEHDGTIFFEEMAPLNPNIIVYGDKAYDLPQNVIKIKEQFNIDIMPIHKRENPKMMLFGIILTKWFVESDKPLNRLFNWLIEHTDIQNAAKCRSNKGALLHIFGKIATALCIYIFFNS